LIQAQVQCLRFTKFRENKVLTMVWNDSNYLLVTGLFESENDVNNLLQQLHTLGVSSTHVTVLMSDRTRDKYATIKRENKAPEGANIGGISGASLGALIGGLTMAGSLLIPGLNLLVAGPIVGAIAGGAIGTAAGSMVGALIGAGIPEYEAKAYEKHLEKEGNVLIAAHVLGEKVSDVKAVFKNAGAREIKIDADIVQSEVSVS
jgi:hypothetical protein